MKKISFGQLMSLLLICRFFTLMTYVPLISEGYGLTEQMAGTAASVLIQVGIGFVLIFLNKRYACMSITEIASAQSRTAGVIFGAVYFVFFIINSANGVLHFQDFVSEIFLPHSSGAVIAFLIAAAAAYCASLGIEGLARGCSVIFFVFCAAAALLIGLSLQNAELINFSFDPSCAAYSLPAAISADLSRSGEIVLAGFAIKYIGKRNEDANRGIFGYLALKLALLELVFGVMVIVLGDFLHVLRYPLLTLGSYTGLIQRLDAFYMIVWTLSAAASCAVYIFFAADILTGLIPKLRHGTYICGAVVFLAALPYIITNSDSSAAYRAAVSQAGVLITGLFIPLILLVCKDKENGKAAVRDA